MRSELPLPIYGINKAMSTPHQPGRTTPDCLNVRPQDPVSGREGIAKRAGLAEVTGTATRINGANKAQHIASVTFGRENISFSETSSPIEDDGVWDNTVPSEGPSRHVVTDRQGASYFLDGAAGVVKYNADGNRVWTHDLPIKGTEHVVRALAIDSISNLYVATSQEQNLSDASFEPVNVTASQGDNRVFRISQIENVDKDQTTRLTMEMEINGYVPDLQVKGEFLFLALNRPEPDDTSVGYTAEVLVVRGAGVNSPSLTTSPAIIARREVPYPVNGIAINDSGEIVGCSEAFTERMTNLKYPELSRPHNGTNTPNFWTPAKLRNAPGRIWSWYVPDAAIEDVSGNFPANFGEVDAWLDITGKGRDFASAFVAASSEINKPGELPTWRTRILGDAPGVHFDASAGSSGQGLATAKNDASLEPDAAGQQRTAWPSYGESSSRARNAQFAFFVVARPDRVATQGAIIAQRNDNALLGAGNNRDERAVVANSIAGATVSNPAAGRLRYHVVAGDTTGTPASAYPPDVTSGSGFSPNDVDLSATDPNAALVGFLTDGSVEVATTPPDNANRTPTFARWEANGVPIDRWQDEALFSQQIVTLGWAEADGGNDWGRYTGDVFEMLCIAREDPEDPAESEERVLSHQRTGAGDATDDAVHVDHDNSDADEWERIVGYLAHKYGLQHLLPDDAHANTHPYRVVPPTDPDDIDLTDWYSSPLAVTWKLGSGSLPVKWALVGYGGMGYGVALNSAGNVWCVGEQDPLGAGIPVNEDDDFRLLQDDGDAVTPTTAHAKWSDLGFDDGYGNRYVKMVVDSSLHCYFPRFSTGTPSDAPTVIVTSGPISEEVEYTNDVGAANLAQPAYAVAISKNDPDMGVSVNRARFMYVAGHNDNVGGTGVFQQNARKVALVQQAHNTNSPRITNVYGIAGGLIRRFTGAGWGAFSSLGPSDIVPGTGSGADPLQFDTNANAYFSSVELFGELFITDGVYPRRLKPALGSPLGTGRIEFLKAEDGGQILERAQLLTAWRGRLVMARSSERKYAWKLSQIGKPANFNEFPAEPFVGQAISGVNAPEAGETPDIINAVYAWTDDWLMFGGDHSISVLVGDPTNQGVIARGDVPGTIGQFLTVTEATGVAFGQSITRDRRDTAFFMSSRGEVFAMPPQGKPTPLSDRSIAADLEAIDFSTHWVRATWNWHDDTVHFWILPFGASDTQTHFVLDVKRGKVVQTDSGDAVSLGWWPDRFGHDDVQPTCVAIVDGDEADDRRMLIGCADGRVRRWDPSSNNDDLNAAGDKVPIDAYCDLWYTPSGATEQMMFTHLQLDLDSNQHGVLVENFGTEASDAFGSGFAPQQLQQGWNPPLMDRVVGNYCKARIRNATQDERFFLQRAGISASRAGDRRPRVFVP